MDVDAKARIIAVDAASHRSCVTAFGEIRKAFTAGSKVQRLAACQNAARRQAPANSCVYRLPLR